MGDIRQGDVYLKRLKRFARLGKTTQVAGNVVAEGEETGHSHKVVGSGKASVVENDQGRHFVVVMMDDTPAELTHETHGVKTVEPGKYEVHEQRQYVSTNEIDIIRD